MNNRVLLVNPWIYDFAAYDYWMKPLGLLYMAAMLRENGMEIRLIDCLDGGSQEYLSCGGNIMPRPRRKHGGHGKFLRERIPPPPALKNIGRPYHRYGITPEIFAQILEKTAPPRLIMVGSMMTYWYPGVFAAIAMLRQSFPDIPILLGGVYATLCEEHAKKNAGADYVLPGAGEKHLEFIVKDLMRQPLFFHPGSEDPSALPFPAWELLNRPDQLPILTSRGCPCRCPYCASRLLQPTFRRRKPHQVAAEILHWHKSLGVVNFSFYDDALLIRPEEMAVPLLEEIIAGKMDLSFHCPNGLHLREITPAIASLLYRAGFKTLRFGLETTDAAKQDKLGGKVSNDHFEQATAYLQEAGYKPEDIAVYLLCGLPGQEAAEIRESILYVRSRGARPILAEYSPIPGTKLWDDACAVATYPLREDPIYQNNSLLPCAQPSLTPTAYHDLKQLSRRTNLPDARNFS